MTKLEAIRLLGGTRSAAARRIGITPQAIRAWPDVLTAAIEDRVIAAYTREHAPEIIGNATRAAKA